MLIGRSCMCNYNPHELQNSFWIYLISTYVRRCAKKQQVLDLSEAGTRLCNMTQSFIYSLLLSGEDDTSILVKFDAIEFVLIPESAEGRCEKRAERCSITNVLLVLKIF